MGHPVVLNSDPVVKLPRDSEAKMTVERRKPMQRMSGSENLKETALYDGAENPIIYSRELSPALECTFDLTYFPFDKQTCSIILTVGIEHVNFVRLLALELSFSGEKSLPNFNVFRWNFEMIIFIHSMIAKK